MKAASWTEKRATRSVTEFRRQPFEQAAGPAAHAIRRSRIGGQALEDVPRRGFAALAQIKQRLRLLGKWAPSGVGGREFEQAGAQHVGWPAVDLVPDPEQLGEIAQHRIAGGVVRGVIPQAQGGILFPGVEPQRGGAQAGQGAISGAAFAGDLVKFNERGVADDTRGGSGGFRRFEEDRGDTVGFARLMRPPCLPARDADNDDRGRANQHAAIFLQEFLRAIRAEFLIDFGEDIRHGDPSGMPGTTGAPNHTRPAPSEQTPSVEGAEPAGEHGQSEADEPGWPPAYFLFERCARSGGERNVLFIFCGQDGSMPWCSHAVVVVLLLGACTGPVDAILSGASIAVVPLFGRTMPDIAYSGLTGRDCSLVRLDQGKTWCREIESPPEAPLFCTRSLATVDCWVSEARQPLPARRGVADGPRQLTVAQERDRTRGWPGLLPAEPQGGDP